MVKSMTGFGRCEWEDGDRKVIVEIKSVNHRFCDINIKMPKKLGLFETAIRNVIKDYVERGKLDVFISYEDISEHDLCLKYNQALAEEYLKSIEKIGEDFQIPVNVTAEDLSKYPEVFTLEEQNVDEDTLWKILEETLRKACEQLCQARAQEGEKLRKDLLDKLDGMGEQISFIEERSPQILEEYQQKLRTKVEELLGDSTADEARILTEVTIFADKICVDEELVRLKSHVESMKAALDKQESVGRKLDFLAQEMNREANTILSKSNDLAVSNCAIDLKTEIEKIREQVQNIE